MYNYSSRTDFSGGKRYTIERFKKDVAIYNQLLNSPSTEMTQIVSQLYDQLVNLPNPEKFIENIENIFIRNNLPKVGKYFRIFEQLYPKKRLNELIMIPLVQYLPLNLRIAYVGLLCFVIYSNHIFSRGSHL